MIKRTGRSGCDAIAILQKTMKNPLTQNIFRRLLAHPKYRMAVIGASLVYLLSPLDISPDVFPVVGWIDDGILATLVAAEMGQLLLERRQRAKETQQAQKSSETV